MKRWTARTWHKVTTGLTLTTVIGMLSAFAGVVVVDAVTNPAHALSQHPLVRYWGCKKLLGLWKYEAVCLDMLKPPQIVSGCKWHNH